MVVRDGLSDHFRLANSQAPITSVICGSSEDTILFAKYLFENNILSTPFVYPSVPKNAGVVRLIAGANILIEDVGRAVEIISRYPKK